MQYQLITLSDWAKMMFPKQEFKQPTLNRWAATGQISPQPIKVSRMWMCRTDAHFVGLRQSQKSISDPLVARIYYDERSPQNS